MPSPTTLTAIAGTVAFVLQALGVSLPAMNDASKNLAARVDNLGELRRCIADLDEYKDDWKLCVEKCP